MDYYIIGKGQPIIFFHGFGLSPKFYNPLFKKLEKKYLIIAPFLSQLKDFSCLSDLISDQLDQMRIRNKLVVVGHSMGGQLAAKFALTYSSRVSHLILLDGLVYPYNKTLIKAFLDIISDTLKDIYQLIHWRNMFLSLLYLAKLLTQPANFKYQIDYCLRSTLEKELSKITTKTLILWGKDDKVLPVNYGYKIKQKINNAVLKIRPGNHLWFLKETDGAVKLIDKFIHED